MSTIQRLLKAVLPRTWAEAMEAESRQWTMQCACGWEQSVWDAGGVRWKASGEPQRQVQCPNCGPRWVRVCKKT